MALKSSTKLDEDPDESVYFDFDEIDLQDATFIVKIYKQLLKGKKPGLKKNFQNTKAPFKSNAPMKADKKFRYI